MKTKKQKTCPLIYNCDLKTWKKKVENRPQNRPKKWALKFWKPYFLMFSRFFTKLCCKWFFEKFCRMFDRILGFSFLKIIFRHWIWNEIPENLEQNCCFKTVFCLLFRNGFLQPVAIFFWHLSLWNVSWAVVALKIFFGAFLFENCFLALIAAKVIFCSCRFESYFGR